MDLYRPFIDMALHALLNPYNVQQLYLSRFISMSIQWFPGHPH